MGMPVGASDDPVYGADASKILQHVPVFIYHAPADEKTLNRLLLDDEVRVVIMGDHSLNRYRKTACAGQTIP